MTNIRWRREMKPREDDKGLGERLLVVFTCHKMCVDQSSGRTVNRRGSRWWKEKKTLRSKVVWPTHTSYCFHYLLLLRSVRGRMMIILLCCNNFERKRKQANFRGFAKDSNDSGRELPVLKWPDRCEPVATVWVQHILRAGRTRAPCEITGCTHNNIIIRYCYKIIPPLPASPFSRRVRIVSVSRYYIEP